jgi:hypothetical protein
MECGLHSAPAPVGGSLAGGGGAVPAWKGAQLPCRPRTRLRQPPMFASVPPTSTSPPDGVSLGRDLGDGTFLGCWLAGRRPYSHGCACSMGGPARQPTKCSSWMDQPLTWPAVDHRPAAGSAHSATPAWQPCAAGCSREQQAQGAAEAAPLHPGPHGGVCPNGCLSKDCQDRSPVLCGCE